MMHTCRICGPKDIQLFAPGEMKKKSSICRKCNSEANKRRYIKAYVPADPGHRFRDKDFRSEWKEFPKVGA
jgi:hypothetical protein